jgi:hypothetical protein
MAAVAVAGAASAQVTITGSMAVGFAAKSFANLADGTAVRSQAGFGSNGSSITFSASEDLGAGLSVSASVGIDDAEYGGNVTGNGSSVTVAGGFGSVMMAMGEETCDGLSQLGGGARLDGAGFGCAANSADFLKYSFPEMVPGLKLAVGKGDYITTSSIETANGLGGDVASTTWYADYATGPVSIGLNVTQYDESYGTGNYLNKRRVFGSFDLGVAKISAGVQTGGVAQTAKSDRTVIGLSVPMGALTAGIGYGSIKTQAAGSSTSSTVATTGVNLKYALSKRTAIVGEFDRTGGTGYASSSAAAAGIKEESLNRVLLTHSF